MLYGILGFFVGGIIGGYLVGRMCGTEYKKRIDDLRDERDTLSKENETFREKDREQRENDIFEKEMQLDLPSLSKEYGSDSFDKEFADRAHPNEDDYDPDDIYLIDQVEFEKNLKIRDNESLTYYQVDGILVDSVNEQIRNEERVIGVEAMDKVGDCSEDYLYVSNDVDDKMYEIIVEHNQSFYRDVMGL